MDNLTARPQLLKQANLSFIRKVLKNKGTVTRAEIAWETKISSTTIRSLLTEMQQNGEIESVGYDESSGGRKAERYRLKMDRYYGAAFCITDDKINCLTINICGEVVETIELGISDGDVETPIISCLDDLTARMEIKSIGVGVPGIVDGSGYMKKNHDNKFYKVDIGEKLAKRYDIPVIIENDLNAITIGIGRCYEKRYPYRHPENMNMAFIYFEEGCISAGFIVNGKIIRGWNNYAGELGLIPIDSEKSLSARMAKPVDNEEYIKLIIKITSWICGILNPQYVALGGPTFRKECLGDIIDGLYSLLPQKMFADILYSPEVQHDYFEGMAFLTAEKMFDEVQFVKE